MTTDVRNIHVRQEAPDLDTQSIISFMQSWYMRSFPLFYPLLHTPPHFLVLAFLFPPKTRVKLTSFDQRLLHPTKRECTLIMAFDVYVLRIPSWEKSATPSTKDCKVCSSPIMAVCVLQHPRTLALGGVITVQLQCHLGKPAVRPLSSYSLSVSPLER